jgi:hypothetical protein
MNHNENSVIDVMKGMMNIDSRNISSNVSLIRRIRSTFGFTPDVVLKVWMLLQATYTLPKNATIKHLLWMYSYLKTYVPYEQYCNWYNCSDKTFRSWVWFFATKVAELNMVS